MYCDHEHVAIQRVRTHVFLTLILIDTLQLFSQSQVLEIQVMPLFLLFRPRILLRTLIFLTLTLVDTFQLFIDVQVFTQQIKLLFLLFRLRVLLRALI